MPCSKSSKLHNEKTRFPVRKRVFKSSLLCAYPLPSGSSVLRHNDDGANRAQLGRVYPGIWEAWSLIVAMVVIFVFLFQSPAIG